MNPLLVDVEIGGSTIRAGTAHFSLRRGRLATSFQYDLEYLARPTAYALDPSLPLSGGTHHTDGLPGAFSDCAPDRWGRNLIARRLRWQAQAEGRTPPEVSDVDHLLGVSDHTRQGALRFRPSPDRPYLDPEPRVPKLVELPLLLAAADRAARVDPDLAEIKVLLAAGTGTLGGARPKASVLDGQRLLIAKFPKPGDRWDVMAWEKTALDLAEMAGVRVPARRLVRIDGRGVLLLQRFDREDGRRVGYMSAMTMLGRRDGAGADYVDAAEALGDIAAYAGAELRELWRRIALSVVVHNTDDHLRNHGLLRSGSGWRLSPAFDINPDPDLGKPRTTSIGGAVHRHEELDGLMLNADAFGLTRDRAATILSEVQQAAAEWDRVAAANGIGRQERQAFAEIFESPAA